MSESGAKQIRIVAGIEARPPTFEAAFMETLAIKRFLDFVLADIKFQFSAMNRDKRTDRNELLEAQETAVLLSNYIQRLREGVEAMHPSEKA